jgi:hypothetical protein
MDERPVVGASASLAAMLDYVETAGCAVFPCKPRGKTPLTPNGCKDATTDACQVQRWAEQHPGCNWAVATGTAGAGNLLVVDVDGIWDTPGDAWTEIVNSAGGMPETPTVLTGSGHGMHWYFSLPAGVRVGNSAGKLALGIDVRCEGGYVIAPPSEHPSGYRYAWVRHPSDAAIRPIPAPLLDLLLPKTRRLPTASPRIAESSTSLAVRILDEECRRIAGAVVGTRNQTAFAASAAVGNLVAGGELVLAEAARSLLEAALGCGLPQREAENVVANGLEVGLTTPRTLRTRNAS